MNAQTIRAIVFVIGKLKIDRNASSVLDLACSKSYGFRGDVDDSHISVCDCNRTTQVSGSQYTGKYILFRRDNNKHIDLVVTHNHTFNGYDCDSGEIFSGVISGRTITFYDRGRSKGLAYSV